MNQATRTGARGVRAGDVQRDQQPVNNERRSDDGAKCGLFCPQETRGKAQGVVPTRYTAWAAESRMWHNLLAQAPGIRSSTFVLIATPDLPSDTRIVPVTFSSMQNVLRVLYPRTALRADVLPPGSCHWRAHMPLRLTPISFRTLKPARSTNV